MSLPKFGIFDELVDIHFPGGTGPVCLVCYAESVAGYVLVPVTALGSISMAIFQGGVQAPSSADGFESQPSGGTVNTVPNLNKQYVNWRYATAPFSLNGSGGGHCAGTCVVPINEPTTTRSLSFTGTFTASPHEIWDGFYTDPPANTNPEMVVDEDWSVQMRFYLVRNLKDYSFSAGVHTFTFTDGVTVTDSGAQMDGLTFPKARFVQAPKEVTGRYPNGVANHGTQPHLHTGDTMTFNVDATEAGFTATVSGGGDGWLTDTFTAHLA